MTTFAHAEDARCVAHGPAPPAQQKTETAMGLPKKACREPSHLVMPIQVRGTGDHKVFENIVLAETAIVV